MAVSCNLLGGTSYDCNTPTGGGYSQVAYIGQRKDLAVPFNGVNFDENTNLVNAISFNQYAGLSKFISPKNSHDGGSDTPPNGAGIVSLFTHTVNSRLFPSSPLETLNLEALAKIQDAFIILERRDQKNEEMVFEVYGADAGLTVTASPQNGGKDNTADTGFNYTFVSDGENKARYYFFDTDYATTKALLESYVI